MYRPEEIAYNISQSRSHVISKKWYERFRSYWYYANESWPWNRMMLFKTMNVNKCKNITHKHISFWHMMCLLPMTTNLFGFCFSFSNWRCLSFCCIYNLLHIICTILDQVVSISSTKHFFDFCWVTLFNHPFFFLACSFRDFLWCYV